MILFQVFGGVQMNYFTKHKDKFLRLVSLFIKYLLFYIVSIVFFECFLFLLSLIIGSDAYISFRIIVNVVEFFETALFIIMIPILFFCEVFNVSF